MYFEMALWWKPTHKKWGHLRDLFQKCIPDQRSKAVTTLDVTFHVSYKSFYSLTTEVIQNPHFSSYVCVFCSINTILNHLIMHD